MLSLLLFIWCVNCVPECSFVKFLFCVRVYSVSHFCEFIISQSHAGIFGRVITLGLVMKLYVSWIKILRSVGSQPSDGSDKPVDLDKNMVFIFN